MFGFAKLGIITTKLGISYQYMGAFPASEAVNAKYALRDTHVTLLVIFLFVQAVYVGIRVYVNSFLAIRHTIEEGVRYGNFKS